MAECAEVLKSLWNAIAFVHCVREDTVVTPVPIPSEWLQRHQLNAGNSQLSQFREVTHRRVECSLIGNRAQMKLVDHQRFERPALPSCIAPGKRLRIKDGGPLVHALRLPARSGIRPESAIVESVRIAHPRTGIRAKEREFSRTTGGHRIIAPVQIEFQCALLWRPHTEGGS